MDFLSYLNVADREALLAAAYRKSFETDEVILREGETRNAIFVIYSGQARVERSHMDIDVEIARLGVGEIFGEMGFIEGFEASASVVADETSEIGVIDAQRVQALIDADPYFYGRFYQSLAQILSRRLRATTDVGIAEFAWGGRGFSLVSEDVGEMVEMDWGGGSPLRDGS